MPYQYLFTYILAVLNLLKTILVLYPCKQIDPVGPLYNGEDYNKD